MMKTRLAIATMGLLCTLGATVLISEAETIFAGAIVDIDQVRQTITFQTREGRTWTIPVADSNILTQQRVVKGDRVRIEVELSENDLSERITKITKNRKVNSSNQALFSIASWNSSRCWRSLRSTWPRIAVPTRLLWGRHDRAAPLSVAEATHVRFGWPQAICG